MSTIPTAERRLLAELGELSDRIRVLRAEGHPNAVKITPLEAQTSLKWQELRLLRAGPINVEPFAGPQPRIDGPLHGQAAALLGALGFEHVKVVFKEPPKT